MSPIDPTQLTATPTSASANAVAATGLAAAPAARTGWASLRDLNSYHWFVFVVAALGWLADCMDQQLFNLARRSAVMELLKPHYSDAAELRAQVANWSGYATSIFLIGWATGGLTFGVMGDRWGRVKTMLLTILLYSVFTGLSALAVGVWDFAFYRFLTGLGVGGEFAVGVALLAEVMPAHARPYTLGLLQAFSAFGNVTAALLFMLAGYLEEQGVFRNLYVFGYGPVTAWRLLFVVGMFPAIIALLVRRRLKEPEAWVQMVKHKDGRKAGSYAELLGQSPWNRRAFFGLALAFAGVVGLWGIGFFAVDLQQLVFDTSLRQQGMEGNQLEGVKKFYAGVTSLMTNVGAFCGMFAFSWITGYTGRRPAFLISLILAMISTALVFMKFQTIGDIFWMIPIMGFCQLSLFGGYAIYFPELFPTRLRSTGTSFCYNVGRFVAAVGPTALGLLTSEVFTAAHGYGNEGMRYAGLTMCSVFIIGVLALPFLPETRGKPLPE